METTGITDAASRLGMTEEDIRLLIDNEELVEVSPGRISKESIYAYSGLKPGGKQTHEQKAKQSNHSENPNSSHRIYTIVEASRKIGFASDSTIHHHINKGTIRRVEGGVDADDVDAFIRTRKRAPKVKAKTIKPNTKPVTKQEAKQLQNDLNAGRITVKPIGDAPEDKHTPPLVDDTLFVEVEETFYKEVKAEPLYTETEVKEALKVAYRKGLEAAHRHLMKGVA